MVVGIRAGADAGAGGALAATVLIGDLLADDRELNVAALRDVDGAAGGGVAGVEGDAGTVVVILEVRVDPGGGESTGALESEGGGIEEVVNVKVGELHAHSLADTSGLVVGDGGVDDLEAVEGARALAHDRVHTDGTDTAALGGTSDDDGDGVGTGAEVDAAVAVVLAVVGVGGGNLLVGVVAVVTADERRLEDELAVVVDGEGVTAAVKIGDAEDGGSNGDKVVGLADSGAGSAKVELVPAAVHLKVHWAARSVVMVVRAALRRGRRAGRADLGGRRALSAVMMVVVAGLASAAAGPAGAGGRAGVATGTRAVGVGAHVRVNGGAWDGSLTRAEVGVLGDGRVRAAVALGHVSLGNGQAEEGGAGEEGGVLQREHQMRLFWSAGPAAFLDEM